MDNPKPDLPRLAVARRTMHVRKLASLPIAVTAILIVSSVAFGATFVQAVIGPSSGATPVVVGDDDPTDGPSFPAAESPAVSATPENGTPKPVSATPRSVAETPEPTPGPSEPAATPQPVAATPKPASGEDPSPVDLGPLAIADHLDLTVGFSWTAYTGGQTQLLRFHLSSARFSPKPSGG